MKKLLLLLLAIGMVACEAPEEATPNNCKDCWVILGYNKTIYQSPGLAPIYEFKISTKNECTSEERLFFKTLTYDFIYNSGNCYNP
jgi:hypothetical protein